MICPDCQGQKRFGKRPCGRCQGTSSVDKEQREWTRIGQDFKRRRIARFELAPAAAKRLGISEAELDLMERGAVDSTRLADA